jgi:hypothetical protein
MLEPRRMLSTYVVNTTADGLSLGSGVVSLRIAIADANAHAGADTITFSPTVFPSNSTHTIDLTGGQLAITGSTTITGPGDSALVVNAQGKSRVFQVSSGATVSISGMEITQGVASSAANVTAIGGGILNSGSLTLSNDLLSVDDAKGGAGTSSVIAGGGAEGGAIYSNGSLTISSSTIENDKAIGGAGYDQETGAGGAAAGGAIYTTGSLGISGSTSILSCSATGGENGSLEIANLPGNASGGAIYAGAGLTVSGATIEDNSADAGVSANESDVSGAVARGGAIYSLGTSTISNSVVNQNTALGGADQSLLEDVDTGGSAYGGAIFTTASLTLNSTELEKNTVTGGLANLGQGAQGGAPVAGGDAEGGAIYTTAKLTISQGTIETNSVTGNIGSGGGIYSTNSLTMSSSTVSGNKATATDGDQYGLAEAGSGISAGGGIYSKGTLTITSSTISGNDATGAAAQYYGAAGGAGEGAGIASLGSATIGTTTISGNVATGGLGGESVDDGNQTSGAGGSGEGGGIYSTASLAVTASTVSGNLAVGGEGKGGDYSGAGGTGEGAGVFSTSTLTFTNSTIANNNAKGGTGGSGVGGGESGVGGKGIAGAIVTSNTTTLSVTTITGNTATKGSGGSGASAGTASDAGVLIQSGKTILYNTIVSANEIGSTSSDITGTANSSSSHNLIGVGGGLTNGTNGNKVGVTNPKLSSLGFYGGLTQTMPPVSGSPAIGGGSAALLPSGLTTDQRGFPRISGSSTDIGAVEFGNASISGSIFNDLNANGVKDSGEPALSGWTLFIDLNIDGLPDNGEPTAVTSSTGAFKFSNLPAGKYRIWQEIPTGYRCDSPSVFFSDVTVTAGQNATGIVFADTQKISISGTVFNDANDNGLQNSGETGLSGWRVYVDLTDTGTYKSTDPSVVTGTGGTWSFTTLAAGTYYIRIVPQSGWKLTTPSSGYFKFTVGAGGIRVDNLFGEFK